jgi:hypothetical protein
MILKEFTKHDIRKYLTSQVKLLAEDDYFPPGTLTENIVRPLLNGADGMFLWARLMIGYLKSPALTPSRRLKEVSAVILPEELAKMYRRIMELIESSGVAQRKLAKTALQWVMCSATPLTSSLLHEALIFDDEADIVDQSNKFKDFEDTISIVTGGLVESNVSLDTDPTENRTVMRPIHLTAIDFLQTSELPPRCINNLRVCVTCIRSLVRQAPTEIPAAIVRGDLSIPVVSNDKLVNYVAKYWMHLLEQTFYGESSLEILNRSVFFLACKELLESLSSFLTQPLVVTAWLESFYRLSNFSTSERSRFLELHVHSDLA